MISDNPIDAMHPHSVATGSWMQSRRIIGRKIVKQQTVSLDKANILITHLEDKSGEGIESVQKKLETGSQL